MVCPFLSGFLDLFSSCLTGKHKIIWQRNSSQAAQKIQTSLESWNRISRPRNRSIIFTSSCSFYRPHVDSCFFAMCNIIIFCGISAKYLLRGGKNRDLFSVETSQLQQEATAFPPAPPPSSSKRHGLPSYMGHSRLGKQNQWIGRRGEVKQKTKPF